MKLRKETNAVKSTRVGSLLASTYASIPTFASNKFVQNSISLEMTPNTNQSNNLYKITLD